MNQYHDDWWLFQDFFLEFIYLLFCSDVFWQTRAWNFNIYVVVWVVWVFLVAGHRLKLRARALRIIYTVIHPTFLKRIFLPNQLGIIFQILISTFRYFSWNEKSNYSATKQKILAFHFQMKNESTRVPKYTHFSTYS